MSGEVETQPAHMRPSHMSMWLCCWARTQGLESWKSSPDLGRSEQWQTWLGLLAIHVSSFKIMHKLGPLESFLIGSYLGYTRHEGLSVYPLHFSSVSFIALTIPSCCLCPLFLASLILTACCLQLGANSHQHALFLPPSPHSPRSISQWVHPSESFSALRLWLLFLAYHVSSNLTGPMGC